MSHGFLHVAVKDRSNLAYFRHQLIKLVREDGLGAIGKRMIRIVVDLYQQAVSAHSNRSARKRNNFVAFAGTMAGINHNRKMAEPLYRGHNAQVERIASVIGKGAYPALAQNYLIVT